MERTYYSLAKQQRLLMRITYIVILVTCLYSCKRNRVGIKSGKSEKLVEVVKRINNNAPYVWTKGYTVIRATYNDKLFTYQYVINDSLELYSKLAKHIPEFKENLLVGIQTSTKDEKDVYNDFVEYGVTLKSVFECKISKEIYSFSISPEEIDKAINADISPHERLKQFTETQQKGLPSTIMRGIVISEIELRDSSVYMKFLVDDLNNLLSEEDNFGMEWIDWYSKNNKSYLGLVAEADMGIVFYFCDPISYYNTTIELTGREIKLLSLQ